MEVQFRALFFAGGAMEPASSFCRLWRLFWITSTSTPFTSCSMTKMAGDRAQSPDVVTHDEI